MPCTENSSQGEEATMKSKFPSRIKSAVTTRTLTPDQQQFFGISDGSCRSIPMHSQPRVEKVRLQPNLPQNKSRSLTLELADLKERLAQALVALAERAAKTSLATSRYPISAS